VDDDAAVTGLTDQGFAEWLAARAGRALTALRERGEHPDPDALRKAGDRLSHDLLRTELARWRPADAVLSEEDDGARRPWAGDHRPARAGAARVWIVDPLDGTREYAEPGRTDWAVHVALWQGDPAARGQGAGGGAERRGPDGGAPEAAGPTATRLDPSGPAKGGPDGVLAAGAVALPARGLVLGTGVAPPPAAPDGPLRVAVSRTRPPAFVSRMIEDLGAVGVPMGSAGAKVCAVVTGEVDAYVHGGGQYEWDSAAPVAVARAAGLHASRLDGSPLRYNQPDPRLPDLVVCRPEWAGRLLAAIAAAQAATAPAG